MKNLIAVVVVLASSMVFSAPSDKLINALIKVESNGNVLAVGDNGNAVGCLQIWKIVVDDVNGFSKTKYTYEDRKSKSKSIEICKAYLNWYGKVYQKNTGKVPTNSVYARIWNGGPSGYKKSATIKYWNKVAKHI